jgi:hypothetical protein
MALVEATGVLGAFSVEDGMFSCAGRASARPRAIAEPGVMLAGAVSAALRSSAVGLFVAVLVAVEARSIVLESLEAGARCSYRSENGVPEAKEIVGCLLRFEIDYQGSHCFVRVVSAKP